MKFKKGDKIYLDKRGKFGLETADYKLGCLDGTYKLEKNTVYIVGTNPYNNLIRICDKYVMILPFEHHQDHFKLYEQV